MQFVNACRVSFGNGPMFRNDGVEHLTTQYIVFLITICQGVKR